MRVLTPDEMQELVEHLEARPDLWLSHEGTWVRKIGEDSYALALKLRNGLPGGLCMITQKALSWSAEGTDEYVFWLLQKYTAYATRLHVIAVLRKHGVVEGIEVMSKELCDLQGGPFVRKREK